MNENAKNTAPKPGADGKKKGILIIVLVLVITAAVALYVQKQKFESTDNAQVDGNIIPIRTKLTGYVERICFTDNQHVNKGDTLIVLETTDLKAQVAQAQARLESAVAGIEISKTGKTSASFVTTAADFSALAAQENITAAKARLDQAQSDFSRTKVLYEKNASTAQAFDASKSALEMAQAQYQSAQKQFKALSAQKENAGSQIILQTLQLQASQSRVAEAQAQLDAMTYLLSNATVIAPCSGILSKKNVEVGQIVLAGSALAMLIDDKDIWVTANFKETQLDRLKNGQKVTIHLDAYKNVNLSGVVQSSAGAAGSKFALLPADNASGNFVKVTQRVPVRIELTDIVNPDSRAIFPGLSAIVKVQVK